MRVVLILVITLILLSGTLPENSFAQGRKALAKLPALVDSVNELLATDGFNKSQIFGAIENG